MDIDWQHKLEDIKTRNLHILQTEKMTDCNFLVGNENNKKLFAAHKLILATASPVFERMLYGIFAEKSNPILITDIQPDTFKTMLEYIYSDHANINSLKKGFELYHAADKYMLKFIQKQCIDNLHPKVNKNNAFQCYEFAKMFQLETLKEKSMEIIADDACTILKQPTFNDISFGTLMDILDQDRLNISEFRLFNALSRFAEKRVLFGENSDQNDEHEINQISTMISTDPFQDFICKIPEDENQNNTVRETNGINLINIENETKTANKDFAVNKIDLLSFKEAVKKIRFHGMTPQQFAEGPATSNLINRDEKLSFFVLISKPQNYKPPVPEGFSSSNEKR